MRKGEFGYLNSFKKRRLISTVIIAGAMALVIGLGLWLNKGDIKNIYTVVGILFALPMARSLSGLFVVLPIKTMDAGQQQEIIQTLSHAGSDQFLWDLALSSEEKVRYFPCILWSDHHLVAWYEGKDLEAETYLTNIMKNNCHRVTVNVENDKESFIKRAKNTNFGVTSEEEWERIKNTILIYEM